MSGDVSGDNVPANNSYVINNTEKANPAVNTRTRGIRRGWATKRRPAWR